MRRRVLRAVRLDRPVDAVGLWPVTFLRTDKPFPSYSQHYEYFKVMRLRSAMISVDGRPLRHEQPAS
jgi:hypothetical protein